ncbi:MAG: tetratricopeptide repeat protein, partial [Planctomycetota bacterium]
MRKQAQWAVLLFAAALLLPAWSVQGQDQTAAAKKLLAANGSLRAKRYETAATQYEEFLSRFKDHRDRAAARYGLGISLYQLKKYPEAERQLIEAIRSKDFQQAPEARALLGQSRMARNDMNGALEAFGELAGKHPDNPLAELAGLNIVRLLYQMDKTDEATKKADDFLKKHKDSGYRTGVLYYKGLSQRKSGNPAAAAESFQAVAAVENSPYLLNALLLAGQSYEAAGQTDKALAAYRKLIDRADEGRKADGRYSLAVALQRAGKHSDAVEAFEQLLKTHEGPYAPAGRFQMGISQLKAGKADDAARTFQQVIKSDKDRSRRGRYWLARARMAKDDHDAAAKLLDEVLDSKGNLPEEAAARYDLATCRMKLGQHAQAAEDFKTVTERHAQSPYAPDAAYRRAWCLQQAGKTKEAIELAEKIARQDDHPMAGPAAELAAECHFTLGQYDQAAKTFSRLAASAEGDNARRFALRRGQSAFLVGDSKKAIDVLKPVAEQKSAGDDRIGRQAMLYLGQALLKTDQPAQAADILHRFVRSEAKAGRLEGRYYLARALRRADKQDEAAKVLEPFEKVKAQESAIVPYAWFELAEIHYQKDQPEPAEKLLERIIQAKAPKPVTASAQLLRGWIAYDAKEYKTAAERFGRFAE